MTNEITFWSVARRMWNSRCTKESLLFVWTVWALCRVSLRNVQNSRAFYADNLKQESLISCTLRSVFFCDFTQGRTVVSHTRLGATYLFLLQEPSCPRRSSRTAWPSFTPRRKLEFTQNVVSAEIVNKLCTNERHFDCCNSTEIPLVFSLVSVLWCTVVG